MCSDPRCSAPRGPADRKHVELVIRRYGWACQGVLDDEPDRPGWSYTIGLADSAPQRCSSSACRTMSPT